ncbi:S-glutathionyl-(chloro)hydroquinone reductase [Tulasnella sp. JGI-2019a]|nr:S-glutathionyl-(chloro)hydroquinone reductase [Tulasnella sp. JGI-2019a]
MSQDDNQKNISNVASTDGHSRRLPSTFRNVIESGGEYPPEKGRYHLFISYGCPWANRATIVRQLKGLQDFIGITVVSPVLTAKGWAFQKAAEKEVAGTEDDPLNGCSHIREYYFKVNPEYDGRFTVPLLWDKKSESIVNNESAEIIRMFNTAFNDLLPVEKSKLDLYPNELRKDIDEVNDWLYNTVNSGVYKTGFATSQEAYDANVKPLFASLDRLEGILKGKNYLVGERLTEADVRLFTTMIRFDPVYHGLFKCNYGLIRHMYPEINRWMKNLYWNNPAFKATINFEHIKVGYYYFQQHNPTRIVPAGPTPDIEEL